jgi:hypothetical protein
MAHKGRKPTRPNANPNNLTEVARALNISYDRCRRLRQDGLQVRPDGSYDLTEARAYDRARRARTPGLGSETARVWHERFVRAKTRAAETELARSLKLIIDIDEARQQWRRRTEQIRNRLAVVGQQLAPRIAHRGPQEVQAILDERVMKILRELARTPVTHE